MSCLLCGSGNEAQFAAEMIIHFSGLKNLDKPGVEASPKLLVCLDCGFSHFTLPKIELSFLGGAPPETLTLESCLEYLALHGRIALRK